MLLEDLGIGNITFGGATVAALAWMWRTMTGVKDTVSALELKIAENYVTRPELKVLEDKLDRHYEIANAKMDNIINLIVHQKV